MSSWRKTTNFLLPRTIRRHIMALGDLLHCAMTSPNPDWSLEIDHGIYGRADKLIRAILQTEYGETLTKKIMAQIDHGKSTSFGKDIEVATGQTIKEHGLITISVDLLKHHQQHGYYATQAEINKFQTWDVPNVIRATGGNRNIFFIHKDKESVDDKIIGWNYIAEDGSRLIIFSDD